MLPKIVNLLLQLIQILWRFNFDSALISKLWPASAMRTITVLWLLCFLNAVSFFVKFVLEDCWLVNTIAMPWTIGCFDFGFVSGFMYLSNYTIICLSCLFPTLNTQPLLNPTPNRPSAHLHLNALLIELFGLNRLDLNSLRDIDIIELGSGMILCHLFIDLPWNSLAK